VGFIDAEFPKLDVTAYDDETPMKKRRWIPEAY